MATKKKTPAKTTAKRAAPAKSRAKKTPSPAAEEANRAARAEFEAHRKRAAASAETANPGPAPPGPYPSGHPYAHTGPHPGGHPMFGWSAPWGPPPGMPWPASAPGTIPIPGGQSVAPSGSLLENFGTILRLGADLINAGLQGGTQMMYGMGGSGVPGHHGPAAHGHDHWSGHGCGCEPHSDCCCSSCAPYVDCCCCYGHQDCQPGVHNCP